MRALDAPYSHHSGTVPLATITPDQLVAVAFVVLFTVLPPPLKLQLEIWAFGPRFRIVKVAELPLVTAAGPSRIGGVTVMSASPSEGWPELSSQSLKGAMVPVTVAVPGERRDTKPVSTDATEECLEDYDAGRPAVSQLAGLPSSPRGKELSGSGEPPAPCACDEAWTGRLPSRRPAHSNSYQEA